jgi:hypothetical protein
MAEKKFCLPTPPSVGEAIDLYGFLCPILKMLPYDVYLRVEIEGTPVILEWTNHDCPYVRKHYESGNMQALQKEARDAGYVWLSVISSAPGKQGHVSPAEADELTAGRGAAPTAVLLDVDGAMGRAYGAKTTPHMFVIDGAGTLVYMGGIDDRATTDPADVEGAENYVRLALADLGAGGPVSNPATRPYGCSVKY